MKQQEIEFEDSYKKFINSKPDKFILNFLKQHNMSRAELSRQIKVGRCTVERWIRKEIVISRKNYEKLMAFINKKIVALVLNYTSAFLFFCECFNLCFF